MINNSKLTIIIAWTLLIFVGYNVLSAEAVEKEDIRKMNFVNDDEDDYGLKDMAIEQACKDTGGQLKDYNTWCYFDKKGKAAGNEAEFEHQLEDRGLSNLYYDKEDGSDEWEKYQAEKQEKSLKGEQEYQKYVVKQSDKINENICKKVDGKWTNEKICDFGKETDGPKADKFFELLDETPGAIIYDTSNNELYEEPTPVIEDWGNTVVTDEEQEQINSAAQYQQDKHEQLSQSSPIPDVLKEKYEEPEEEDEPEEEEEDNSDSESEE